MKYWIGITDHEWYRFLAGQKPDEANFWQPGGRRVPVMQPSKNQRFETLFETTQS